jgi:hypothetical protein
MVKLLVEESRNVLFCPPFVPLPGKSMVTYSKKESIGPLGDGQFPALMYSRACSSVHTPGAVLVPDGPLGITGVLVIKPPG